MLKAIRIGDFTFQDRRFKPLSDVHSAESQNYLGAGMGATKTGNWRRFSCKRHQIGSVFLEIKAIGDSGLGSGRQKEETTGRQSM
jgi:hypothetical protein